MRVIIAEKDCIYAAVIIILTTMPPPPQLVNIVIHTLRFKFFS